MKLSLVFIHGGAVHGDAMIFTAGLMRKICCITGTTSGRVWWNEDGLLKQDHRVAAFTAYNAPNLEEDLARGQGEYLSSLGTLIGTAELDRFNPIAQDAYSRWRQSGSTSADELVRKVGARVR